MIHLTHVNIKFAEPVIVDSELIVPAGKITALAYFIRRAFMKRYSLVIICTAFLVCFLFASCGGEGVPEITEPVADPSGQKFNSWDQYLPLTLKTAEEEEAEIAVKAFLI